VAYGGNGKKGVDQYLGRKKGGTDEEDYKKTTRIKRKALRGDIKKKQAHDGKRGEKCLGAMGTPRHIHRPPAKSRGDVGS